MLKSISKINFRELFASQSFLFFSAIFIFLLSIFLRSRTDIGVDTGVYIDLGKKIADGKRYYYDFFEGNFPLSFYFYALEHKIALLTKINPIILSEIIINSLGIISIFSAAKILKKTTIYDNKIEYNVIIIAYFLGFFLRPYAITIGEFGTKTSLLLMLLFPYISYSFLPKQELKTADLIYRGCLMGLITCLKPNYLILIIFIEIFYLIRAKNINSFFRIDRLLMVLIGLLYLFLIIKFIPEFIEFIVPMWPKIYESYRSSAIFFDHVINFIGGKFLVYSLIFLVFSKVKPDFNDKILAIFFISVSLLMISEGLMSIDQMVVFYSIATICFAKFICNLVLKQGLEGRANHWMILVLIFLAIVNREPFPLFFGLMAILVSFWFIIGITLYCCLADKIRLKMPIIFFILFLGSLLIAQSFKNLNIYAAFNLFFLIIILFALEKSSDKKRISIFSVVAITMSCAFFLSIYKDSIFERNKLITHFKDMAFHIKTHSPSEKDSFLSISQDISVEFPLLIYLKKENYAKIHFDAFHPELAMSGSGGRMYDIKDADSNFTFSYILSNIKDQLKNNNIKLIFVDSGRSVGRRACYIGFLEYYFLDPEFKKLFFENFRFENQIIIEEKRKFIKKNEQNIRYKDLSPSTRYIDKNFEVYVRKN